MAGQEAPQRSNRIACSLVGSEQGSQLPAHRDWHTLGAFLVCPPIWASLPTPPLSRGCVPGPVPHCLSALPGPRTQAVSVALATIYAAAMVGLAPSAVLSS